jgi:hypothetical protein
MLIIFGHIDHFSIKNTNGIEYLNLVYSIRQQYFFVHVLLYILLVETANFSAKMITENKYFSPLGVYIFTNFLDTPVTFFLSGALSLMVISVSRMCGVVFPNVHWLRLKRKSVLVILTAIWYKTIDAKRRKKIKDPLSIPGLIHGQMAE